MTANRIMFNPELGQIILRLTAQGKSKKEIADEVGIPERTVERFVLKIRNEFNAKNVAHLVYLACKSKFL